MAPPIEVSQLEKAASAQEVSLIIRGENLNKNEIVQRAKDALNAAAKASKLEDKKKLIEGSRLVLQSELDEVVTEIRTNADTKLVDLKIVILQAKEEALKEQRELAGTAESFVNEGREVINDVMNTKTGTDVAKTAGYILAAGAGGIVAYKLTDKIVNGIQIIWNYPIGWLIKKAAGWISPSLRNRLEKIENGIFGTLKVGAGAVGGALSAIFLRKGLRGIPTPGGIRDSIWDSAKEFFNDNLIENIPLIPKNVKDNMKFQVKKEPAGANPTPTGSPDQNDQRSPAHPNPAPGNGQPSPENPEGKNWGEIAWDTIKNGGGLLFEGGVVSLCTGVSVIALQGKALYEIEQWLMNKKELDGEFWLVYTTSGASYLIGRSVWKLLMYGEKPLPKNIGGSLWSVAKVGFGPLTFAKDAAKLSTHLLKVRGGAKFKAHFLTQSIPARTFRIARNWTRQRFLEMDIRNPAGVSKTARYYGNVCDTIELLEMDGSQTKIDLQTQKKIPREGTKLADAIKEEIHLRDRLREGLTNMEGRQIDDPLVREAISKRTATNFRAEFTEIRTRLSQLHNEALPQATNEPINPAPESERRIAELEEQVKRQSAALEHSTEHLSGTKDLVLEKNAHIHELTENLRAANEQLQAAQKKMTSDLEGQLVVQEGLKNKVSELQNRLTETTQAKGTETEVAKKTQAELAEAKQTLKAQTEQIKALQIQLKGVSDVYHEARVSLDKADTKIRDLETRLQEKAPGVPGEKKISTSGQAEATDKTNSKPGAAERGPGPGPAASGGVKPNTSPRTGPGHEGAKVETTVPQRPRPEAPGILGVEKTPVDSAVRAQGSLAKTGLKTGEERTRPSEERERARESEKGNPRPEERTRVRPREIKFKGR
ncbi:MAG: hypothetical protein WC840_01230 [Candidatus Peribacteraceae bacterium]